MIYEIFYLLRGIKSQILQYKRYQNSDMKTKTAYFLLLFVALLVNTSISATIIITPFQQTTLQINSTSAKNNNVQSITDSTLLVQLIRQYFGCFKFVNSICIKCKDNYFLNQQGKCSRVSQNCRVFNLEQGICNQCIRGFYIIDGICYQNNQSNPIKDHCTIWSQKQCIKCEKSYYLVKGACKAVDSQCRNWDALGKCGKCYPGYSLQKDNSCKQSSSVKCLPYEFLNQNQNCQALPNNCQTWDLYNGRCVQCFSSFTLIDWKCSCLSQKSQCFNQNCLKYQLQNQTLCQICKPRFKLNQKTFVCEQQKIPQKPLPKNCLKWNENKTACGQCNSKFILINSNKQCIEQIANCTKYSPLGDCLLCIDGYEVIQKKCLLKAISMNSSQFYGCDTWNFNQSKCQFCYKNFDINKQGRCIFDEDHCISRNQRDFCTKCQQGYIVRDGNCQIIITQGDNQNKQGCKMFDWVNNLCLMCEDEFLLNQKGSCQKPLQNCIQMNNKTCTKCLINYELIKNQCVSYSKSKCIQKQLNGSCKKCDNSYALLNGECKTFKQLGTILLDYSQYSPEKLREKITIFTDNIKY